MKRLILILMLCSVISLYAQPIGSSLSGGEYKTEASECLSGEDYNRIGKKLNKNKSLLKSKLLKNKKSNFQPKFIWPVESSESIDFNYSSCITNYVDHDPTYNGSQYGASNLDYNCGNRTYDTTNGYNHKGIDIASWPFSWYQYENDLSKIIAAEEGTILAKDDGNDDDHCSCSGNWNAVYIMHPDGSQAWYGHLKSNSLTSKNVGDYVEKGEYLGIMASSGCSTGPHLHFEVYDSNNNLIDPYQGLCNSMNSESWWESQPNYQNPTLNAIVTHNAQPSLGCPSQNELMNRSKCFKKGERLYTAFYYSDQDAGMTSHMRIIQPNGNTWASWDHTSPSFYTCSYWYWYWTLPSQGPYGTWTIEGEFNNKILSEQFLLVDENCPDCELEYFGQNLLDGTIQNTANYASYGTIESKQKVENEVSYSSDRFSLLLPSFEVHLGAILTVNTNECIDNN